MVIMVRQCVTVHLPRKFSGTHTLQFSCLPFPPFDCPSGLASLPPPSFFSLSLQLPSFPPFDCSSCLASLSFPPSCLSSLSLSCLVTRYRYTIDELYGMLRGIQERSEAYRDWCRQVDLILDSVGDDKTGISTCTLCA